MRSIASRASRAAAGMYPALLERPALVVPTRACGAGAPRHRVRRSRMRCSIRSRAAAWPTGVTVPLCRSATTRSRRSRRPSLSSRAPASSRTQSSSTGWDMAACHQVPAGRRIAAGRVPGHPGMTVTSDNVPGMGNGPPPGHPGRRRAGQHPPDLRPDPARGRGRVRRRHRAGRGRPGAVHRVVHRHRDRHRHTADRPKTCPGRTDQRIHARCLTHGRPAGHRAILLSSGNGSPVRTRDLPPWDSQDQHRTVLLASVRVRALV